MKHKTRFFRSAKKNVRYSFKFASIISPGSIHNMSLMNSSKSNRIYVKQSYVMLTWMSYIKDSQTSKKKNKSEGSMSEQNNEPSFFIFPKRENKATFLKAPMAHKTFSQEQFLSKSYTLSISFTNSVRENYQLTSINSSLLTILKLRSDILPFETNLIFLKRLRITLPCSDLNFMRIE